MNARLIADQSVLMFVNLLGRSSLNRGRSISDCSAVLSRAGAFSSIRQHRGNESQPGNRKQKLS